MFVGGQVAEPDHHHTSKERCLLRPVNGWVPTTTRISHTPAERSRRVPPLRRVCRCPASLSDLVIPTPLEIEVGIRLNAEQVQRLPKEALDLRFCYLNQTCARRDSNPSRPWPRPRCRR